MFIFRKLFILVVGLVAIFLGGSYVLESFAENQMSTSIGRTFGLRTRPAVEIDAFPIIWRVFQGRIPRIRIDAHDLVVNKLDIAELTVDLRGVRANLDVLIRSDRFDLSVDQGQGTALLTEDSVNAAIRRAGENAHMTFRPDGGVFVRADPVVAGRSRRFEATGRLFLDGRTLTFKPSKVTMDGGAVPPGLDAYARRQTTVTVEIPKLPGNILPAQVVVTEAQVALVANLKQYVLKLRSEERRVGKECR